MPLSALPPLSRDFGCIRCQYNLRGLMVAGNCPECNHPISASVNAPQNLDVLCEQKCDWYASTAEQADVDVNGVILIADAISLASRRARGLGRGNSDGEQHVGAAEVCASLGELALACFGGPDHAVRGLDEWGIRRSEDVGRVVFAMVNERLVGASPQDALSDFDGLFTLESIYADVPRWAPSRPVFGDRHPLLALGMLVTVNAGLFLLLIWALRRVSP